MICANLLVTSLHQCKKPLLSHLLGDSGPNRAVQGLWTGIAGLFDSSATLRFQSPRTCRSIRVLIQTGIWWVRGGRTRECFWDCRDSLWRREEGLGCTDSGPEKIEEGVGLAKFDAVAGSIVFTWENYSTQTFATIFGNDPC